MFCFAVAASVVFSALPELDYVALPAVRASAARDVRENQLHSVFRPAAERVADDSSSTQGDVVLWVADAEQVRGKTKVRKAVAEDYDDLMPIFNQQTEQLEDKYAVIECCCFLSVCLSVGLCVCRRMYVPVCCVCL